MWCGDNWKSRTWHFETDFTSSSTFFSFLHEYFDWLQVQPVYLPNFQILYPSFSAYTVKIDDGDSAWEAEAARVADVTSAVPCTGSAARVRLFTADSAGTRLRGRGDVNRRSVINWHACFLPSHSWTGHGSQGGRGSGMTVGLRGGMRVRGQTGSKSPETESKNSHCKVRKWEASEWSRADSFPEAHLKMLFRLLSPQYQHVKKTPSSTGSK